MSDEGQCEVMSLVRLVSGAAWHGCGCPPGVGLSYERVVFHWSDLVHRYAECVCYHGQAAGGRGIHTSQACCGLDFAAARLQWARAPTRVGSDPQHVHGL